MTLRVPLCLTLFLLFSKCVFAQQQPSAPPAPADPPQAPPPVAVIAQNAPQAPPAEPATPPAAPDAPAPFSFFFNSDSYLGIYAEEITTVNMRQYGLSAPRGVAVGRVVKDSPAERAGLRKDDVILRFNGEEVTGARKLNRLISEVAPDHTVRLTISREGREQEINVTLAKREDFPRSFQMTLPPEGLDRLNNDLGRLGTDLGRLQDMPLLNGDEFSFAFSSNRRIGVGTSALTKQLAEYFGVPGGRGVLVTSVSENGPAAKAGLKAGDVITAVDGNGIEKVSDLMRELNRKREGEITLTVIRDKSQRTFKVTPERGAGGFEFSPDIQITPQVGSLVIPRITVPAVKIRSMPNFVMPKIVIPKITIPKITIPKIKPVTIPFPL
ncbi:MAG TPA: PDZ domain-containing protein [Pyrinomonadaceae bacterium]|nr:PDZ domain-containing protein [Pyrinomonadaceae bacterium]